MKNVLETILTQNEYQDIKEFVSVLIVLPKEDRAVLLSNAKALRARQEIEKEKEK